MTHEKMPTDGAARPWTRWWWPGSAVDRPGIERSLRELKEAGFEGVEITPIYGIPGWEDRFVPYLSTEWCDLFRHTLQVAESLGLEVDVAMGTGWPPGGPDVPIPHQNARAVCERGRITGLPSGFKVKRAAPGGEGPALNPYSPDAMRHYLERFEPLLRHCAPFRPRALFHDSFEYQADWAPEVAAEFQRLNGYNPDSVAEVLLGRGQEETVARARADYRRTLAELHRRYLEVWTEWAHAHGLMTRNQAHGAPGNLLDLYAAADIPETETFGASFLPVPGLRRDPAKVRPEQPNPLTATLAASAAHVAGKRLVSCEACTWLREHFHSSLAAIKVELDQMFLAGINHVVFHGTCYSPVDVPWPGWLFYASVHFNSRNTIWRDLPELTAYVSRCQSLLQAGEPDQDLLLYWPFEDLIHEPGESLRRTFTIHGLEWLTRTPYGVVAETLWRSGVAFDFISDRLLENARVEANGSIRMPGGSYRAILIPPCRFMPEETLVRLIQLARAGAPICTVGNLGWEPPGLAHLTERRKRLDTLMADATKWFRVLPEICSLWREGLIPVEPAAEAGLRVLRRRHAEGTDYFAANLGARDFDAWFPVARPFRSALLFDPLTGRMGRARCRANSVRLQLRSGQSVFIRLREAPAGDLPGWPIWQPVGEPIALEGRWHAEFVEGGPVLPPPFETDRLDSWAVLGGADAGSFAGTARYRLRFEWHSREQAEEWRLDLGDVRESARVFLNGQFVGTAWCLPFQLLVGPYLRPGFNELVLEVTNLCANRIRAMDRAGVPWKRFGNIGIVNVRYQPLDASEWDIQPSGLLGPVRLIPLAGEEFA